MSPDVLEDKLEARDGQKPEQAWNLARWPTGMTAEAGSNRLFIASGSFWRGYFKLSSEALYNPEDERTPYTLLFDTRTWTPIPKVPVKRFRGFTYKVPAVAPTR
jgi:hypothetical protein